jgi:hypothetical protein
VALDPTRSESSQSLPGHVAGYGLEEYIALVMSLLEVLVWRSVPITLLSTKSYFPRMLILLLSKLESIATSLPGMVSYTTSSLLSRGGTTSICPARLIRLIRTQMLILWTSSTYHQTVNSHLSMKFVLAKALSLVAGDQPLCWYRHGWLRIHNTWRMKPGAQSISY